MQSVYSFQREQRNVLSSALVSIKKTCPKNNIKKDRSKMEEGSSPIVRMLSSPLSPSTPSVLSPMSSRVVLFLLSAAVLLGQVTGAPKGYDFDVYDEAYGPNLVKVDKVVDYYSKPQYAFGYEVDDYYNQLSHGRWEIRDGDITKGQYRVLLPDGRIQIVSYIADKFGYRPTVEYIGKGAHPPPPPAYAHVKIPKVFEAAAVPVPVPSPAVFPVADGPHPYVNAPFGYGGGPVVEEYPVKIKVNSLPVNAPFPALDPYATGFGYGSYGLGVDPAFGASNKIYKKRALLYDRTLFRKDVEKRADAPLARVVRKIKRKRNSSTSQEKKSTK